MSVREALVFALQKYPEKVEVVELSELIIESARQNAKRPAYLKVAVPDEVVKGIKGPADRRKTTLLVVSIPNDVAERASSRIILPNEIT